MANVPSAEKRNRQRLRRRARNLLHLSSMRTEVKKVRTLVDDGDPAKAAEKLKAAVRLIDKAAQKGVIKKTTAARSISRLVRAVAGSKAPVATTGSPKAKAGKGKKTAPAAKKRAPKAKG